MFLQCVVSVVQRQKLTANGLNKPTIECLIDVPQDILIPIPLLLIIGESFQPAETFRNNILMLTFLRSRKKNCLFRIVFCLVILCKEANTL